MSDETVPMPVGGDALAEELREQGCAWPKAGARSILAALERAGFAVVETGDRSRWTVRKWPKSRLTTIWNVFEPDGTFSGTFDTWDEAMEWATSIGTRIEYWLENQA